jgi:hypothetical protein
LIDSGPNKFLGHREARQQALEIAGVAEHGMQAPRQFALGGARRADQQGVFAGQGGEQAQADALAAFDQPGFERVEQGPQAGREIGIHGRDCRQGPGRRIRASALAVRRSRTVSRPARGKFIPAHGR